MTKGQGSSFVIGHWVLVILSTFGFRHSSFAGRRRMRFGIGAKLGLLASVLIVGTGLVLYLTMLHWGRDLLTRQELADLGAETRLGGRDLLVVIDGLRRTALEQAVQPALQEFLQGPDHRPASDQIEASFRAA